MSVASLLAYLVAGVAMPLNWYVAWRLVRLSRVSPQLRVLRERAIVAVATALIVTVFAAVFLNNELPQPPLTPDATRLLTRGLALVLSVPPSCYWLWLYRGVQP